MESERPQILELPLGPARLYVSAGGAASYRADDLGEHRVHLLLTRQDNGRIEALEVSVRNGEGRGVSMPLVRVLPLSRIEAGLNDPSVAEELSELVPQYGALGGLLPRAGWIEEHDLALASVERPLRQKRRRRRRPPSTTVPYETAKKPDVFYREIAQLFSEATARGVRGPASEIAQETGVPVTTVHRWVKEARRRGFLSPAGKRGKAAAE
jgi:hypothetical protein